jgi:hypothetical protein
MRGRDAGPALLYANATIGATAKENGAVQGRAVKGREVERLLMLNA